MKIVMLTTNMALGGAETQVALLSIELRRRGHEIHVVSLLPASAFTEDLQQAHVPLHTPGLTRVPLTLLQLRPEVLHCHMFHANAMGRLMRTLLPFPVLVSTLHSTAESRRGSNSVRWRDVVYRVTDRLADAVVAVSQAVAERHRAARATSKAVVIPNGIDTSLFRPDPERRIRTRAELGLTDEFVWLAVGRLMWKKNFAVLLRAFSFESNAVLMIAGAGPDGEELRALAGPNVRFLGERRDIPAVMNAADGFVLSSVVEGLPLALLEAGASAMPCVATDVGGVRETGIGMIVAPDDLRKGMEAIMAMAEENRRDFGNTARQQVEKNYSLQATASKWEALYENLNAST